MPNSDLLHTNIFHFFLHLLVYHFICCAIFLPTATAPLCFFYISLLEWNHFPLFSFLLWPRGYREYLQFPEQLPSFLLFLKKRKKEIKLLFSLVGTLNELMTRTCIVYQQSAQSLLYDFIPSKMLPWGWVSSQFSQRLKSLCPSVNFNDCVAGSMTFISVHPPSSPRSWGS